MTYTGKALTQSVTIKVKAKVNGALKALTKKDHAVSYTNNKEVGTATVKVAGKGHYTGTLTKTFKIILAKPSFKSLVSYAKGKLTSRYSSVKGASGYQIRYGLKKNLSDGKTISAAKTGRTVSGLKSGRTYYVKVRAYRTYNGKRSYSAWSAGDCWKNSLFSKIAS